MKLSITISSLGSKFAPIILQGEYAQQIEKARALGYSMVELHIRDPKILDLDPIIKSLEQTKLQVSTIGTGQAYVDDRIYFSSFDQAIRRAAVQRIKDQIDLGELLHAKVIIGTIKGQLPLIEEDRTKAFGLVVDCMKECLDYAEQHDVQLTLEAINRYETNFLNSAAQTVAFIEPLGSKRLGLHLDTFHMNIEEASIEETIREYGSKHLSHLHIADSNRWAPGQGHIEFSKIIKELKAIDYQGFLGLECLPMPDPETTAKHALEYMRKLLE